MKTKKIIGLFIVLSLMVGLIVMAGCEAEEAVEPEPEDPDEEVAEPEEWQPEDDMRALIPFGPGGSGDLLTRAFARVAENYFEVDIAPENATGGSGAVAIAELLSYDPDGHTFMNHSSTFPYVVASGELDVDPESVRPVGCVAAAPQVIAVRDDAPWETLDELVEDLNERPGEIVAGSSHMYGTNHAWYLDFVTTADVEFAEYVPYDGGAEAMTALLEGGIKVNFPSLEPPSEFVKAGDVRLLGITGQERHPDFPDVPTLQEQGYDVAENMIWRGFFVHGDTPDHIVEKYEEVIAQVVEDPEFLEFMENSADDLYHLNADEFSQLFYETIELGEELFEEVLD